MNLHQQCICRHCRKEFDKPVSGRHPIYCSDACKMKSYRQRKRSEETVTLRNSKTSDKLAERVQELEAQLKGTNAALCAMRSLADRMAVECWKERGSPVRRKSLASAYHEFIHANKLDFIK